MRELRLLSDELVDDVIQQSAQTGLSPLQILVQRVLIAPVDIEIVDLLMRGDEAIPGYELTGLIGRGGMGAVYRALQKNLNRFVALKTILARQADDKVALARFEREATTIAQLSHPNIVCALDFGRHQGRLYLAMEIVDGEDLNSFVARQTRLHESTAWGIARQIAGGLLHASKAGVIHRDIKPANILLVEPPEGYPLRRGLPMAKLTDFGLAILNSQQAVSERLTSRDAAIGSPHYMAPEQFGGEEYDTRADIYSLGATIYHMLTGYPPWSGKSLQQIVAAKLSGQRPSLKDDQPEWTSQTVNLLESMLDPHADSRANDYGELMIAMDAIIHSQAALAANTTVIRSAVRLGQGDALPTLMVQTGATSTIARQGLSATVQAQLDDCNHQTHESQINSPLQTSATITIAAPNLVAAGEDCTQPKHLLSIDRVFFARPWSWISATVIGLVLFAGVYAYLTGRFAAPIPVEATSDQIQLFNGQDLLSPSIVYQVGGWGTHDGRIVHEEGSFGYLTFEVPKWEMFSFEVNVELGPKNHVYVQFAHNNPEDLGVRPSLRLKGNEAELGSQSEVRGLFISRGSRYSLDVDRAAHSVRIQREIARWVVLVDGQAIGEIRADTRQINTITLVAEKAQQSTSETDSNSVPTNTAFADIVATRLAVKM